MIMRKNAQVTIMMKALFLITALALIILPSAANAHLVLYPGFETSTSCRAFSSIGLLDELDQAKAGGFWPAGNIDGLLNFKRTWLSEGSFSNLHPNFDFAGNTPPNMGWTAPTTALLFAGQADTSRNPAAIDSVPVKKTPDPGPASIILFAPGLAGILVRRNWPQKLSLRTMKRSISEIIYRASAFPDHGDLPRRILLATGFIAYFQFIHFKVRTIQLNQ